MEVKKATPFVTSIDTRTLADALAKVDPGAFVSYSALSAIIGRDVTKAARGVLDAARRTVQRDTRIVFDVVRTEGLRRLVDPEIARSGDVTRGKIHRAASRGIKRVSCADYDKLADGDKVAHNASLSMLGAVKLFTTRRAVRKLEEATGIAQSKIPIRETLALFRKPRAAKVSP